LEIYVFNQWVEDWREEEDELYERIETQFEEGLQFLTLGFGVPSYCGTFDDEDYPKGLDYEADRLATWKLDAIGVALVALDNEGQDELPWTVKVVIERSKGA
jgi:YD repeat-containing protein